jgi:hypothetical protein
VWGSCQTQAEGAAAVGRTWARGGSIAKRPGPSNPPNRRRRLKRGPKTYTTSGSCPSTRNSRWSPRWSSRR